MRIVIAGGHGKIALLLARQLAEAGHEPIGLIRNPKHANDLITAGATPVVLDLEQSTVQDVADVLLGADAAVFAAGAGEGSGNDRKFSLDRDGAILLADAALEAGVTRLIVISSVGADAYDATSDDPFQVYLRAKGEADAAVRERDLDWTIVRPVRLTDEPGTGRISVDRSGGSIPRADVAGVVVELLGGAAVRKVIEVSAGELGVAEALGAV
jgi:uncharacterized protein YbjT (DUF2867 family)